MLNPIHKLQAVGQSLWYDNIQRCLLTKPSNAKTSGLAELIARGEIRGVTSNPTIFHNAIAKSSEYDSALIPLAWSGWDAERIFWELAFEDIRSACDIFLPLHTESGGEDGYVSLEVNPSLAYQTNATVTQAKYLWDTIARPNLMIKIPATPEGLPAVRAAIAAGINVNVTLIFSIERYHAVIDAFLAGLDDRLKSGLPVNHIASVASFFVSRLDTKVDAMLPEGSSLYGKTAIAYTKLAYKEFCKVFYGERFARFQAAGCQVQRPLWASTSTKNPAYPDTLYVDELIGPHIVNTVPPQTLDFFRDHGKVEQTLTRDVDGACRTINDLESLGISMAKVTKELEDEGVEAFIKAFTALIKTINERRQNAVSALGRLANPVSRRVVQLEADSISTRLWSHDPTLWTEDKNEQEEIHQRLGWLDLPLTSRYAVGEIRDFTTQVSSDGFNNVLLLGMGGSSLASEVLSLSLSNEKQTRKISVLDSTDPEQILETERNYPFIDTLYIVSSKSGNTVEVNAMFAYFWEKAKNNLGSKVGDHFIAITDPGTELELLAKKRGFRKIFLADPTIGGRNSALSHFGLVLAALMGLDLDQLLDRAERMMQQCAAEIPIQRNPGIVLGAVLGESVLMNCEKFTILADKTVAPFGAWLEQLITESTGKRGKGIVVIDDEPIDQASKYHDDRHFVYLRHNGSFEYAIKDLLEVGQSLIIIDIQDIYDLGAEFYRWEVATAIACHILGINSFNQPDVQDSKERTKNIITAYKQYGKFDEGNTLWEKNGMRLYSTLHLTGTDLEQNLRAYFESARKQDYVSINAFLPRNPEMLTAMTSLRLAIRTKTGCATMVGFGPRFLHSTGQLHKGGPNSGLFLQITADPVNDLDIPGYGLTFGVLERAQALGDYEALAARGRRVLRIHLPEPSALKRVLKAV